MPKIGGIIFTIIIFYGILIGCYYGYKKVKEKQLCNEVAFIGIFMHAFGKHMDEAEEKGVKGYEEYVDYITSKEPIYKKGAPYDNETPFVNINKDFSEQHGKEILKRCKQNVGGFRVSTLYFGDGFYNYPIHKIEV
tara:strand:- start:1863 stop:2270 length:408 start_codon:yes stop_codon:yes gene_type:complete